MSRPIEGEMKTYKTYELLRFAKAVVGDDEEEQYRWLYLQMTGTIWGFDEWYAHVDKRRSKWWPVPM